MTNNYIKHKFSFDVKTLIIILTALTWIILGGIYLPVIAMWLWDWWIDVGAIILYIGVLILIIEFMTKRLKAPNNSQIRFIYAVLGLLAGYVFVASYTFQLEIFSWFSGNVLSTAFNLWGGGPLEFLSLSLGHLFNIPMAIDQFLWIVDIELTFGEAQGFVHVMMWAIIFFGSPIIVALIPKAAFRPFDQENNEWLEVEFYSLYPMPPSTKILKDDILRGDFSFFQNESGAVNDSGIEVYVFKNIHNRYTDIVEMKIVTTTRKNQINRKVFVQPISITDTARRNYFPTEQEKQFINF